MKHFRIVLSFVTFGWPMYLFRILGNICYRMAEDFATVAMKIAGFKPLDPKEVKIMMISKDEMKRIVNESKAQDHELSDQEIIELLERERNERASSEDPPQVG